MDDKDYFSEYIKYYQSKVDNNLELSAKIHKEIDNSDYKENNIYNKYPGYNNPDFIYEISNKMEFSHMKTLLNITDISSKCPGGDDQLIKDDFQFELSNNQQFLKNFINKRTPYRGLVIFHGVGVGKTCSAINISSSFRDDISMAHKEKIICLVPKNIRGGWENTIYDKTKGKEQCSGDSFEDIINRSIYNGRISDKKIKGMINDYYEFYGYLKFANHVKKLIKNVIGKRLLSKVDYEEIEKEIIKENFSNRILIIDEIHNLRDENDETNKGDLKVKLRKGDRVVWENERGAFQYGEIISYEGKDIHKVYFVRREDNDEVEKVSLDTIKKVADDEKKAREIIEKVIDYSDGLRLIMLSATPMFNNQQKSFGY